MHIFDLCKKLRPVLGQQIDKLWAWYLVGSLREKQEVERILNILAVKALNLTYHHTPILLNPPPKETAQGEYVLGEISYNKRTTIPFGLQEHEMPRHIAIFGMSGAGKTNSAYQLVWHLFDKQKPFLIFDWKRNYRDLLTVPIAKGIKVFTVGRSISPFYFNPLIPPPNTEASVWLKKLIEIFGHAYFLGHGVFSLLEQVIDTVYRRFDMYSNPTEYPTLQHVQVLLENYKARGRRRDWLDSTIRAIGTLCFGEMGKVLNFNEHFPIEKLLQKNVVLELDALTNSDKVFLIECLLLWIHQYRLAEGSREQFKHAIIVEEAHHILLRKKQEVEGTESVTDVIMREIRELGECIVIIDQHPSLISQPALGNSYCTLAFNMKHNSDVKAVAACMLLSPEETEYLGRLPVGYAIVKLQDRYFFPFLIQIPEFKIKKGIVTDEFLRDVTRGYIEAKPIDRSNWKNVVHRIRVLSYFDLKTVEKPQNDGLEGKVAPFDEIENSQGSFTAESNENVDIIGNKPYNKGYSGYFTAEKPLYIKKVDCGDNLPSESAKNRENEISYLGSSASINSQRASNILNKPRLDSFSALPAVEKPQSEKRGADGVFLQTDKIKKKKTEKLLLEDIFKNPTIAITARYKRLSLSSYMGNTCKQELIQKEYIKLIEIATSKARIKLMELTTKGIAYLRELGYERKTSLRSGGLEHEFWKQQAKEKLRAMGYLPEQIRQEVPIGDGETVDLVVSNGKRIAIEIETGKSDAVRNVRKCLDASFDGVVSIATNKKAFEKIKNRLGKAGLYEHPKVKVVWMK